VKYVFDTNIISALRQPTKNPAVSAWATTVSADSTYTTAFNISEIGRGVAKAERLDPPKGKRSREWFEGEVLPGFANRILPFDIEAALILAGYRVPEHAPYDDALIAAVAQANGMAVATRNVKHFQPLGVQVVNPFEFEI